MTSIMGSRNRMVTRRLFHPFRQTRKAAAPRKDNGDNTGCIQASVMPITAAK